MYCENCGKELKENTKFCIYCGTEQTSSVILPAEITVPAPSEPVSESSAPAISATPEPENIAPTAAEVPEAPEPSEIPTSGTSQQTNSNENEPPLIVTVFPEKSPSPAPTYTLKHLVMCLAVAAVMAVAAGVFAGLYFAA